MNAIHAHEPARYRDLATAIPQASSSTLAETVDALEVAQLVNRQLPGEALPPSYRLTPSGAKLLSRLRRLLEGVRTS